MRGKDTCKKLKEIRLQIARANGIDYAHGNARTKDLAYINTSKNNL
jgi:hypothetical protein